MSEFNQTVLAALARQEAWIATLSLEQQATARVQMALLEMAIRD
jgi:hypothetical protein